MNTALALVNPNQLPIGSLEAYIERVNQAPYLTQEEEYHYALNLKEKGDLMAAQQLVLSHLRYVVRIARGYMGYGLALNDLIQEGSIGLMKAVKRFDPAFGVRLVSFAVHWIKAEIHEFILRNWRIVKVATTKPQRKLFFNLRSAKKRLGWFTQDEVEAVAKDLGVCPKEVLRMEERLNAKDVQFDLPVHEDATEKRLLTPAEYLEDTSENPEEHLENKNWEEHSDDQLKIALQKLDQRSQFILEKRWLVPDQKKATLQELANTYNISPERVRQLEKNALDKLRGFITSSEA